MLYKLAETNKTLDGSDNINSKTYYKLNPLTCLFIKEYKFVIIFNTSNTEKMTKNIIMYIYIPRSFPTIQESDQDQTVQGSRRHNTPAPRSASSLPGDKIQRRRFPIILAPWDSKKFIIAEQLQ